MESEKGWKKVAALHGSAWSDQQQAATSTQTQRSRWNAGATKSREGTGKLQMSKSVLVTDATSNGDLGIDKSLAQVERSQGRPRRNGEEGGWKELLRRLCWLPI
nr:hypothetical protein CFP56_21885 [Quercus suber]